MENFSYLFQLILHYSYMGHLNVSQDFNTHQTVLMENLLSGTETTYKQEKQA